MRLFTGCQGLGLASGPEAPGGWTEQAGREPGMCVFSCLSPAHGSRAVTLGEKGILTNPYPPADKVSP